MRLSQQAPADPGLDVDLARYRELAEALPQLVWAARPDGYCDYLSRRWVEYTGVDEERHHGTGWLEAVHPDDRANTFAAWTAAIEERARYDVAYRLRAADGTYRWFQARSAPLRGPDGRVIRWLGTSTDIEDARRVEEALRESEDRFRTTLKSSPVTVSNQDRELRYTWMHNPPQGLRVEDVIGRRDADIYERPEDAALAEALKRRVLATGVGERHELPLHLHGVLRTYDLTVEPLRDLTGAVVGVTCAAVDVTERRQAEEEREVLRKALEDSEARFRGLATSNVIGILACDPETVIDANDAFLEIIGYTRDELHAGAIRWRSLTPPEYAARDQQALEELLRTGTCRPFAKEYARRDGTRVPVLLGATVVSREPLEWVCFVIDATAQRRAEDQLRQAQKLEAVGQLAGGVAHEVNNMMAAVIGFGEFVLNRLGLDHPATSDVNEMVRAANRAAGVTRQLLAFSRRQLMQPEVLDLNLVVQDLRSLLARLLGADKQLEVRAAETGTVLVDRGQIEQVLVNLALNARDAMRPGGVLRISTAEVTLAADAAVDRGVVVRPGRYAQLSVADDGEGMSEEVRRRAFEPFFTTKPVGRGTGLGLSTVYGIVKQSAGYVWLDSTPGRGTTVTVQFPVTAGAEPVPPQPRDGPARARGREAVLVVEDEGLVRRMTARALQEHGYVVFEAEDGRDAQEVLAQPETRVDAVVTDLVMPELNGNELGRWLAAQHPELAVLYMSGYADHDVVARGLLDPAAPFIQKPFTPDELARRVRDLLDSRVAPAP
ncbi:MAG TPA: PAS domain S-box protein [Gemmatimonadales bacterium]|nr:PAS domain S-box protein [Gemmatimonadales bacterium]